MFTTYVFMGLSVTAYLALAGLLVFLCFRTRSKGLMLITAILLGSRFLSPIFDELFKTYIDQWIANHAWNGLTENMSLGEFVMTTAVIKSFLLHIFCLLGGFLIYREWRSGKFGFPQPGHREEPAA